MRSEHTVFVKSCHILDDLVNQINKFPETSDKNVFIILTVISAMLTFTAIALNACTVFTILKTTVLREKLSNFTIMMQSTIDLINGTFLMPLFTYVMVSEITETANCLVTYFLRKLASLMFLFSLTTFSALSHERYMGICQPIFHRTRVKKSHLLKYVVVVCSLQSLAIGLSLYYGDIIRFINGFSSISFLGHTIFVYVKISRAVQIRVRVKEIQQGTNVRRKLVQYLREIKETKTCFLIVACCILCNLPAIILFSGWAEMNSIFKTLLLKKCSTLLIMLNSSLNSVILFWRNQKLRVYAKAPWACWALSAH